MDAFRDGICGSSGVRQTVKLFSSDSADAAVASAARSRATRGGMIVGVVESF